jgi:hypothetical protein
MIEKLIKKSNFFYQISIITCLFGIIGVICYFWMNGTLKQNEENGVIESQYTLKTIERNKPINEIQNLIGKANIKKAIADFESLNDRLSFLDSNISTDEFSQLVISGNKLKKHMIKMLASPKQFDLFRVLSSKIGRFHQHVKGNNWRRLTRMSEQLMARLGKRQYSQREIKILSRNISKSFKKMKEVTTSSVLKRAQKSQIISKIDVMTTEQAMITKLDNDYSRFGKLINNYFNAYRTWFKEINPLLSEQLVLKQQVNRTFIISLLSVVSLSFIFLIVGYFVNKFWVSNGQKLLEANMVEVVENVVKNKTIYRDGGFSDGFYHAVEKNANYAQKRMNFGFIFQESLPIPGMLLDSNLKVIWGNQLFCDSWGISEQKLLNNYLSWDQLSKQTNLSNNNPILEAIKHNVAGIYQIQVSSNNTSKRLPYEMYVRPIEYRNEKTVMVFFYPLTFLEETIVQQSKIIVSPIVKTIEALLAGEANDKFWREIKNEYQDAEVKEIYSRFHEYFEMNEEFQSGLSGSLDNYKDYQTNISQNKEELLEVFTHQSEQFDELSHSLKMIKDKIISISKLKEDMRTNLDKDYSSLLNLGKEHKLVTDKYVELGDSWKETKDLSIQLIQIKEELKQIKAISEDKKIKILSILKGEDFKNVNDQFENYFDTQKDFDKKMQQMDILVSKLSIIGESIESHGFDESLLSSKDIENQRKSYQYFIDKMTSTEDEFVNEVMNAYEAYKLSKRQLNIGAEILNQTDTEPNSGSTSTDATVEDRQLI